jgi:hypothetical protein
MNANFERVKSINGWETGLEMPDLKIGDCILFEGEADEHQGHVIVDIVKPPGGHVCVQYDPEWTPVRNSSMFLYGTKKFRKKVIFKG